MELLKAFPSGALLYTDYGHHPTEINAVYQAMRAKYPHKRLIAIFQPHQARRVLEFWDDFTKTISQFDESLIYNIYAARENLLDLLETFPRKDHTHIKDID
ncbi:MAG: cyanophycin synthetase [bacterium]